MRIADCGLRNRRSTFFVLVSGAVLLAVLLCPTSYAHAELIDRVVAKVNNEVITKSELDQAVAFNVALGGQSDDRLRAETLDGLINRHLLMQEAYRLKFVEVTAEDVNAEVEKLKKRLGSDEAFAALLDRLGMTREQMERMLGERLLVEKFIEKKIELYVRVSRDEEQAYFDKHPAEFKGKPFSEVQKTITARLTSGKLDQQVDKYLAELKSKADIRMIP